MKLFKILNVAGNYGVSVFPPEDVERPPPEELAGEPMGDLVRKIMLKGYTEHEAYMAVQAWAYHAKFDLLQAARGVRVFCETCVARIPLKALPAEPLAWGPIILVAVAAAIFLGLYYWPLLERQYNLRFGTHPWAYLMSYEERLWQAEILNVGSKQFGYYEQGGDLGGVAVGHDRGVGGRKFKDWFWIAAGSLVLEGRHPILYHVYAITGFYVHFCGVGTHIGSGLYKLREGGDDPFKPWGIWSRPGGRIGTPEYSGCWVKWWWL